MEIEPLTPETTLPAFPELEEKPTIPEDNSQQAEVIEDEDIGNNVDLLS
ncbi:MAG: hypothetical protein PQJ46_16495 [Spirochaetales bacterium]|nr:hypothetical protein [Spirochaetales bacterium]